MSVVHLSGSTSWARPGGHLATARPPCGRRGCSAWSMRWTRCPCGEVIGRCVDHHDAEPVLELRAAHCPRPA
jgi:hypothetical protein